MRPRSGSERAAASGRECAARRVATTPLLSRGRYRAAKLPTAVRDSQANRGAAVIVRVTCLALALLRTAASAHAQILKVPRRRRAAGVDDARRLALPDRRHRRRHAPRASGTSVATARSQYRGDARAGDRQSVEHRASTGTYARMPLRYYARSDRGARGDELRRLRRRREHHRRSRSRSTSAAARGFHQVIEAQAGIMRLRRLPRRRRRDLAPLGGDTRLLVRRRLRRRLRIQRPPAMMFVQDLRRLSTATADIGESISLAYQTCDGRRQHRV